MNNINFTGRMAKDIVNYIQKTPPPGCCIIVILTILSLISLPVLCINL